MRGLFFIIFLFLTPVLLFAQERQYSTTNKDAIKHYALANEELDNNMYDNVIEQLQLALHADDNFVEAHELLADLYRQMRRHKEAVEQYDKVIALNPEFSHVAYLRDGDEEVHIASYEDGKKHLEKFLTYEDINPQNMLLGKKL